MFKKKLIRSPKNNRPLGPRGAIDILDIQE